MVPALPVRPAAFVLLAVAIAAACSGSEPTVPTTISLTPTTVNFTSVGQTRQLATTVIDQRGDPVDATDVTWESSDEAVAVVSATGLVTAEGPGTAQVTARLNGIAGNAQISVTQAPAKLQPVSGNAQAGPSGAPLAAPLVVEALDERDNPIAGVEVNFTVTEGGGSVAPAVATTDAGGRASTVFTLGLAITTHEVRATVSGTSLSATFTATATSQPTGLSIFAGNGQSAPAGTPVPTPPAVRVLDGTGQPVPGAQVQFTVERGGGSVANALATTNANGIATPGNWTLGTAGVNTMTATVPALELTGEPALFVATVRPASGFDIQIRHQGSPSSSQLLAFAEAEVRWESLIAGDLPNGQVNFPAGSCGSGSPALNDQVDDLLILADISPIDGPGSVLGAAGPCIIRVQGSLPIVGQMRFDTDDLADLEVSGLLGPVILHEMGHVLGFGTIWGELDLLEDPSLDGGTDPHFTGPRAITAFNAAGGASYTGAKVPVEDCPEDLCEGGGQGTADSHWRESVFRRELMTGFVSLGNNPLSAITLQSFTDMGYTVNLAGADDFTIDAGVRAGPMADRGIRLHEDILRGPILVVDASGSVVGEIRR